MDLVSFGLTTGLCPTAGDPQRLGWDCDQPVALPHDPSTGGLVDQDLFVAPLLEHHQTVGSSKVELSNQVVALLLLDLNVLLLLLNDGCG